MGISAIGSPYQKFGEDSWLRKLSAVVNCRKCEVVIALNCIVATS
jgi:hypothetical protein